MLLSKISNTKIYYTLFFFQPSYNTYVIQTREFVRRRIQSIQSISIRRIYFSNKFYLEFIRNNLFIFTQMHKKPIINRIILSLFCFVMPLERKGNFDSLYTKKSTLGHFPFVPPPELSCWYYLQMAKINLKSFPINRSHSFYYLLEFID